MKRFLTRHREVILYLVFGVLTTLVGFGTYFLVLFFARLCGLYEGQGAYNIVRIFAQILQWVLAVLFAYVTNKKFVFEYQSDNEARTLVAFAGARLFSLGADSLVTFGTIAALTAMGYRTTVCLGIAVTTDLIGKMAAAVIVIVLNYALSKWLVFRKKQVK